MLNRPIRTLLVHFLCQQRDRLVLDVHLDALNALGLNVLLWRFQEAGAPQTHALAVLVDPGKHEREDSHDTAVDGERLDVAEGQDGVGGLEADQETGDETEGGHRHEDRTMAG